MMTPRISLMTPVNTDKKAMKSARCKKGLRNWKKKLVALLFATTVQIAMMPPVVFALPHGGVITKGHATLSYSPNNLLVRQSTPTASFSWAGFNVGLAQSVKYMTPGSRSVSMNFVGGTTPAQIFGKVSSNGILEFMDANGLVFGQGSTVSAAGIRAYGSASPGAPPTGAVTNAGILTAGTGGEVVLVGTEVTNSGTINAPSGQVVLAAGSTVTLTESPSSSLSVATTSGGAVLDSGVIRAENLDGTPGSIILQSGMGSGTTTLAPTAVLDASAPTGGNGGHITLNEYDLVLDNVAPLDVSAPYGTKGTITIDGPMGTTDVGTASGLETIDSSQGSYLSNSNVIDLTANINLGGYSWTPFGNDFSPFDGTFKGSGHTVSGYTITATGNNGTGFIGALGSTGKVENLVVAGTVNGGSDSSIGGVVGINDGTVKTSTNTGSVSGRNFRVVGGNFSGGIVGGVVGANGGTVEHSYNTGNVSGSSSSSGIGSYDVGGVAGTNTGTVETSYNTGSVSGIGISNSDIGGVVGVNGGTVEHSYNTGNVSGGISVGGVVGLNGGTVETSENTGRVSGGIYVGGVVGAVTDRPNQATHDRLNRASWRCVFSS